MGPNVGVTCVVAAEPTTNVSPDGTDGLKVDVETSILSCLPDWGFLPAAVSDVDSALGGATQLGVLLNLGSLKELKESAPTLDPLVAAAVWSHICQEAPLVPPGNWPCRYVASLLFFFFDAIATQTHAASLCRRCPVSLSVAFVDMKERSPRNVARGMK